jgi:hypothetical protein
LDPTATQWHKNFIENAALAADPESVLGKDFRAKFRIPYTMFAEILEATRNSGMFPDDKVKKSGQKPHPLAMKLMGTLRRLALGIPIKGLEDMCGISEAVMIKFIHKWEPWFIEHYHGEWVKMPEGDELDKAQGMFEKCGLAGFVTSMDVVHVKYDRCPWGQRAIHTGKEGYPTLGFQFHCGHNRRIYWHSPEGFPGARNDKTIVKFDDFQHALKSNPIYSERDYEVLVADGEREIRKGVHSLCDGGYHKWITAICGAKHAEEPDLKAFSGLCESVRKDVECLFGILKKRFRILGVASLAHDADNINDVVKVCSVLHNMLLVHDGLAAAGDEDTDWKQVDEGEARSFGVNLGELNTFVVGSHAAYNDVDQVEVDEGWDNKRRGLVRHYALALRAGEVYSLRTRVGRMEAATEVAM